MHLKKFFFFIDCSPLSSSRCQGTGYLMISLVEFRLRLIVLVWDPPSHLGRNVTPTLDNAKGSGWRCQYRNNFMAWGIWSCLVDPSTTALFRTIQNYKTHLCVLFHVSNQVEHSDKEFTRFWLMANYIIILNYISEYWHFERETLFAKSTYKNYIFVLLYVHGLDFIHNQGLKIASPRLHIM